MDCSAAEELVGRLHPEGSGQSLQVQMEICDKWCPSGVCTGTSTVVPKVGLFTWCAICQCRHRAEVLSVLYICADMGAR